MLPKFDRSIKFYSQAAGNGLSWAIYGETGMDRLLDVRQANGGAGPRERARAKIEAKILSAAEAVFAEHGFSGASMSEIARRAGIPKPNLHYYCKTKEELYRRVLRRILDLWLGTADETRPDADPAHALAHYI